MRPGIRETGLPELQRKESFASLLNAACLNDVFRNYLLTDAVRQGCSGHSNQNAESVSRLIPALVSFTLHNKKWSQIPGILFHGLQYFNPEVINQNRRLSLQPEIDFKFILFGADFGSEVDHGDFIPFPGLHRIFFLRKRFALILV